MSRKSKTSKPLSLSSGVNWNKHKKVFSIVFHPKNEQFDDMVAAVKLMHGKWWNDTKKRWYVPASCWRQVITFLREYKLRPTTEAWQIILDIAHGRISPPEPQSQKQELQATG